MTRSVQLRTLLFFLIGLLAVAIGTGVASAAPYGKTSPRVAVMEPGPCAGTSLSTSGKGFSPNEVVTLSRDGAAVAQVSANAAGSFDRAISLAGVSAGAHTITAVGSVSQIAASTAINVRTVNCSGVASTSTTAPVVASANATPSTGLAFTGVQVAAMSVFAVVVLVGGVFLVAVGRRRRV